MKLGRTYRLTIQVSDNPSDVVVIKYPMTLFLSVSRGVLRSTNTATLRIMNLSPDTRKLLFHDRIDVRLYRQVKLEAGYEGEPKLPVIFQGNLMQASSYRQGTEWVTEIDAYSGLYAIQNGDFSFTFDTSYELRDVILNVIKSMKNVKTGLVSPISLGRQRALTLNGRPWEILNQLADGREIDVFIDNEKVYFLERDQYVKLLGTLKITSSETGLLATPRRYDAMVAVKTLFEPTASIGQLCTLVSAEQVYNGSRKVLGISHDGVISGSMSGSLETLLYLWEGKALTGV